MNKYFGFVSLFYLTTMIASCSRSSEENLVSQLSAADYPDCSNDSRFNSFLVKAKYCAAFQNDPKFDINCLDGIKASYLTLGSKCQMQAKDVVGKTVISTLNSHLALIKINDGHSLTLTAFETWSVRAKEYFQRYSEYFSYPETDAADHSYSAESGLSLLSGKILKMTNTYNNDYPLDKQSNGKPIESTELELLKSVIATQTSAVSNDLSSTFFGFMLIDLLRSQEDQIDRLARAYDVTCQFSPCTSAIKPDFYHVIKLFSAIWDPATGVPEIKNISPDADPLVRGIVTALGAEKGRSLLSGLKGCIGRAGTNSSFLFEAIRQKSFNFASMTSRFDQKAMFFDYDNRTLRFGLDRDSYLSVPASMERLANLIGQRANDYDSNLNQWQSNLRQKIETEAEEFSLGKQIDINSLDQANLLSDMFGLGNAIKEQENSLASYLQQIQTIDTKNALGFTNKISAQPITIDKSSVKHENNARTTDVLALSFKSIPLKKGEIVSGIADGKWSPTCGVKASYPELNMAGVTIGPDGFGVTRTSNGFKLESTDKAFRETKFVEASIRAEACVSARGGFDAAGNGAGASASLCATLSSGQRRDWTKGNSSSQGSRLDETAAFQTGVISPNTPFVRYPAGAILGFMLPKGMKDASSAISVKVLERNFAFLAPGDVDLYFIVNDCLDASLDYGSLLATYDVKEPTDGKMKNYLNDMQDLFTKKSSQIDRLLIEGTNLGSQLETLRSGMLAEFSTNHADYASLPLVREFFEYWIDNEGLKLQRKAMRLQKERELARLVEDADRLQGLKSAALNSKFVVQQSLVRASNQLAYYPINESIDTAMDSLSQQIVPILQFHQSSLTGVGNASAEMRKKIMLSTKAKAFAETVRNFLTSTAEAIRKAQGAEPADMVQSHNIAIRFPNPEQVDSLISLPKSDMARAKILWEELFQPRVNVRRSVSLTFNDLYPYINPELGINGPRAGSIRCSQTRTVIEDMVVALAVNPAFVTDDIIDFVNADQQATVTMGPRFSFADSNNFMDFALAPNGIGSVRQVKAGLVKKSTPNYSKLFERTDLMRAGAGLSPFTSILVDGAQFRELIATYPELTVSPDERFPGRVSDVIIGFKVKSFNIPVSPETRLITNCAAVGG